MRVRALSTLVAAGVVLATPYVLSTQRIGAAVDRGGRSRHVQHRTPHGAPLAVHVPRRDGDPGRASRRL